MAWLGNWANRIKCTIASADVASAQTDFPIFIKLAASAGKGGNDTSIVITSLKADANRYKIAVTTSNGTTQCYVEIEYWSYSSSTAALWVKIPSITAASNNIFYLYYDVVQADNTTYVGDTNSTAAASVWDSSYLLVYHMKDGASTSAVYDSTGQNRDGAKKGAAEPAQVAGMVSYGQDFDGINDNITVNAAVVPTTDFTILAWVRMDNSGSNDIVTQWKAGTTGRMEFGFVNTGLLHIGISIGGSSASVGASNISTATWYCIGVKRASNALTIYKGGAVDKSGDSNSSNIEQTMPTLIGTYGAGAYFNGKIDEVRVSSTARSTEYILMSYKSETDALLTFSEFTELGGHLLLPTIMVSIEALELY